MGAEVNTDVEVDAKDTEAIQDHQVETKEEQTVEPTQSDEPTQSFGTERDRLANEMLERQRQERNDDIERELGLQKHPEYEKVEEEEEINSESEEEEQINLEAETNQDEITSDNDEQSDTNIELGETENNEEVQELSSENIDITNNSDLKFKKPGVYGDQVILKIDGQLEQMPLEKALSILQKNQAADKRLENIVLRERQISQKEQELQQQAIVRPQPSEPEIKQPDVVEDADIEQRARTIVQSVEDGEQEKAVESLVSLVKNIGRQPEYTQEPTLTTEQITQLVTQQAKAIEADSVENRLRASGNYEDIFSDPVAYSLATQNVQALVAQGHQASAEQMMIEGMERVRDWRSGMSRDLRLEAEAKAKEPQEKKKKAAPEISESQRLDKKRKSPKAVSSSTTITRPAAKKDETELSSRDKQRLIFEQQKQGRNQRV